MNKISNKILSVSVITLILAQLLSGCSNQTSTSSDTQNNSTAAAESAVVQNYEMIEIAYQEEDLMDEWAPDTSTKIICDGADVSIDGSGAAETNGIITISASGTYVISGTLTEGQVSVDAGKEDLVHIILNGITIVSSNSSAIDGVQSGKIVLTLAEGTENEVTDASQYQYQDTSADEPNAAIFSKDDLTINGNGSLKVNGTYQDGIRSKDDLLIISGILNVNAVEDGIKGKDSIVIKEVILTVNAGLDAMKASNDTEADKGYIVLEGGSYSITSGNDGIQAETVLQITGGSYEIKTGGGSAAVTTAAPSAPMGEKGAMQMPPDNAGAPADFADNAGVPADPADNAGAPADLAASDSNSAETESVSKKALKAGSAVYITDGILNIDAEDDAIHSNANVTISDGQFTISTGDDGVHADSSLVIDGGSIDIAKSYEGLEGLTIDINGGTIHLTASDDGLNAAGGNDANSAGGFRADTFASNEDAYIRITDGYLSIDASGDGIDSNGNLYVDGGIVLVNGPENGGNGALDYNGTAEITGGIMIAAGSAGMAEHLSDTSAQAGILFYYSEVQAADTLLNLSDAEGNSVVSFAPAKEYQTVLISTPDLKQGSAYTLSCGGTAAGDASDGYYGNQTYTGGTQLFEITIDSAAATGGDTSLQQNQPGRGRMNGNKGNRGEFRKND